MLLKHPNFPKLKGTALVATSAISLLAAQQPWKTSSPQQWTAQDVERVMTDSPWAQLAGASFALSEENDPPPGPSAESPQSGMANSNGTADGRWDGGVGRLDRTGPPTLNVTVRWDSALPVRLAAKREHTEARYAPDQLRKNYIITIVGLVPAGRYGQPQLNSRSGDDGVDVRNPEEMLEGVMRYSRLFPRGKSAIRPDDAKLDSATGHLHLFFPRTEGIALSDKEVTFETRFGSLSVVKRFRLKDMVYQGQLEL